MSMDLMRLVVAVVFSIVAGCGGPHTFECADSSGCNSTAGGACVQAPSGKSWCAYPDPNCSSGLRYDSSDVGDSLGGTCVPGTRYTLTLAVGGSGAGTITSMPEGISCSSGTCTGLFFEGTMVDLSAMATTGSFLGWSGDCSGPGSCKVLMDGDHSVGALFGSPGQVLWASTFGGDNDGGGESGYGIAIDGNGDVIVVGDFNNTISPGGMQLTEAGAGDIFVIKMSAADGTVVWAKRFGGSQFDDAQGVAVDASNNIYVTGSFSGTVNFGGGNVTDSGTNGDGFALKLDSNGNYAWLRQLASTDAAFGTAIKVKGSDVIVGGGFLTSLTADGGTVNSAGGFDMFVADLATTDGSRRWLKGFGGTQDETLQSVDVDGAGSVLAAGYFNGSVNFGGGTLTSAGGSDVFVLKLAVGTGAYQSALRFGGTGPEMAFSIAADASNNIIVGGTFFATVSFGCATPLIATRSDRIDVFLAKLTPAGSCSWSKGFGGPDGSGYSTPRLHGLVTNAANDIAIVGNFCGTISFGGDTLAAPGGCYNEDVFAARFNASGMHLNSVRAGGTATELGAAIAQAPDGRFFVTGAFSGFSEFGAHTATAAGMTDIFVAGFAPL